MNPPAPWKNYRKVGGQVQGTLAQAFVEANSCL